MGTIVNIKVITYGYFLNYCAVWLYSIHIGVWILNIAASAGEWNYRDSQSYPASAGRISSRIYSRYTFSKIHSFLNHSSYISCNRHHPGSLVLKIRRFLIFFAIKYYLKQSMSHLNFKMKSLGLNNAVHWICLISTFFLIFSQFHWMYKYEIYLCTQINVKDVNVVSQPKLRRRQ